MHGSLGNENKHKMREEKPAQKEYKRPVQKTCETHAKTHAKKFKKFQKSA